MDNREKWAYATDLHETIIAIGRTPELFYRDTPLLLQTLDGLEQNNKNVKALSRKLSIEKNGSCCDELERRGEK